MKKQIIFLLFVCLCSLGFTHGAFGQSWQPANSVNRESENKKLFSQYQDYGTIPLTKITTPSILEISLIPDQVRLNDFGVYDSTSQTFIPYRFISSNQEIYNQLSIRSIDSGKSIPSLSDKNTSTGYQFEVPSDIGKWGKVDLYLTYNENVTSNVLSLTLGDYVKLPSLITLQALVNGQWVILLNQVSPTSAVIHFPETTATLWVLEMQYVQPLRIQEIALNDLSPQPLKASIRFLALPGHLYQIFANPEYTISDYTDYIEASNLNNPTTVVSGGVVSLKPNNIFIPADIDADGISDSMDNCPQLSNLSQIDVNRNGIGDDCDDFDSDGVLQITDNCSSVPNRDQRDTDGDNVGDACDPDESRITEKYPWIVWFGLGFAVFVFIGLLLVAVRRSKQNISTPTV